MEFGFFIIFAGIVGIAIIAAIVAAISTVVSTAAWVGSKGDEE